MHWLRTIAAVAVLGGAAPPWRGPPPDIETAGLSSAEPERCCKVCREGKACGDTCIARDRSCTRPPGCACDARRDETIMEEETEK